LATVIDCHTKEVIGWAADDNYKTPLIEKAIEMAARNHLLTENAIFHSDRGSNYQCRLVNFWECIHTFPRGDTRGFCGNPPVFRIAFR
jgi:transposase InsO family protein